MAVRLNEKSKTWIVYGKYINAHGNYKHYQKQTQFTSKKQAVLFDNEYKKELEQKQIQDTEVTLADLIKLCSNSQNYSQSSLSHFKRLETILSKKDIYLDKLTVRKVNEIALKLTESNIRLLKRVLNFGYKYRYINEKLSDFIISKKKNIKKKIELFDVNQIIYPSHVFRNSKIELNDIMLFLLDTGLRINECLSLTFDKVENSQLIIDR